MVRSVDAVRGTNAVEPPLFVMGCGHSGTTVLKELLGAQSRIFKTPDDVKLFRLGEAEREEVIARWDAEARAMGCRRWLDKMAAYVHDIDAILARFPHAILFVVVRDGRDVAVSLRKRYGDFARGVQRWLDDNRAALRFASHPAVTFVRYEELVRAPRPTLRRLFARMGEEYEEEIFDFYRQNRQSLSVDFALGEQLERSADQSNFRELRKWQICQPLYDGSGKWQTGMRSDEREYFKAQANDLLIELGYVADGEW